MIDVRRWHSLSSFVFNTEHIVSIVASLVKNCSGLQRQRLLQKFIENDHEKVDRLMELHFKYLSRVNKVDDKIELKKRVSDLLELFRNQILNQIWI